MEERHDSQATGRAAAPEDRLRQWLGALEPLLDRRGPLGEGEAALWRRRLPALIARGELLRYQSSAGAEGLSAPAAGVLHQVLEEARLLQSELTRCAEATGEPSSGPGPVDGSRKPGLDGFERARALVCRSAARREVERLVRAEGDLAEAAPALTLAIPRGRAPGLHGFNLCFFLFLCFQTLIWGCGVAHGADLSAVVLYALILGPFWWWGGYLLQALALAVCSEQLSLDGRRAILRRRWPGATEMELPEDGTPAVQRECWFEINHQPVHCLTLQGSDGRRVRFAVGRDLVEHERLLRSIEGHLDRAA